MKFMSKIRFPETSLFGTYVQDQNLRKSCPIKVMYSTMVFDLMVQATSLLTIVHLPMRLTKVCRFHIPAISPFKTVCFLKHWVSISIWEECCSIIRWPVISKIISAFITMFGIGLGGVFPKFPVNRLIVVQILSISKFLLIYFGISRFRHGIIPASQAEVIVKTLD